MTAPTYHFLTQLAKGEAAERRLDAHFATWFWITPATRNEQRQGIDRWFVGKATGVRRAVEYKTDWRAASTGNAFVETVSVEPGAGHGDAKPGWAYTSQADWLFYYCPGSGGEQVYMCRIHELRPAVLRWARKWPEKTVRNAGYVTKGLLVPLREFEFIAFQIVSL